MTAVPKNSPSAGQEPPLLLNHDHVALSESADALRAATWVLEVLRSLKKLARIASGSKGNSMFDEPTRLKIRVNGLFEHLISRWDCEVLDRNEAPFGILGFTESPKPVSIGPITERSTCFAVLYLAEAVLICLDQCSCSMPLQELQRVEPSPLATMRPKDVEGSSEEVLEWLRKQLPIEMLDGLYEQIVAEMRRAAILAESFARGSENPLLDALEKALPALNKSRELDLYSGLILVALYNWEQSRGDEMIQEQILKAVREFETALGKTVKCKRRRITERLPALRVLCHIEQPRRSQARLTEKGREWVLASDTYRSLRVS